MREVDALSWLRIIEERFGIPGDVFKPYRFFLESEKMLHVVSADHHPELNPVPSSQGIPFMRVYLPWPKLTTEAAMLLGHHATRNILPLDRMQAQHFLARRETSLGENQIGYCTDFGYVLPRYARWTLGVGLYRPGPPEHRLESLYPKALALRGAAIRGENEK